MTKKQRAKREELLKEQRAIKKSLNDMGKLSSLRQPTYRRETQFIPSHGNGIGNAVAKERPEYTGDAMVGVATMHKSNIVPVFSKEDVEHISKMRR